MALAISWLIALPAVSHAQTMPPPQIAVDVWDPLWTDAEAARVFSESRQIVANDGRCLHIVNSDDSSALNGLRTEASFQLRPCDPRMLEQRFIPDANFIKPAMKGRPSSEKKPASQTAWYSACATFRYNAFSLVTRKCGSEYDPDFQRWVFNGKEFVSPMNPFKRCLQAPDPKERLAYVTGSDCDGGPRQQWSWR
jgi:hypothetical protein